MKHATTSIMVYKHVRVVTEETEQNDNDKHK